MRDLYKTTCSRCGGVKDNYLFTPFELKRIGYKRCRKCTKEINSGTNVAQRLIRSGVGRPMGHDFISSNDVDEFINTKDRG